MDAHQANSVNSINSDSSSVSNVNSHRSIVSSVSIVSIDSSDSSDRSDRSDSNDNKFSSSIVTTSVRLKITAILLSINCCNTPFCSILSLGRCIASILSVIHEECRPYQ